ncbi:MAG: response regulator [Actinomycetota bacterium]
MPQTEKSPELQKSCVDMNHGRQSAILNQILVIDDTLENLQLLSILLQEQGYQVRKAMSGKAALRGLKSVLPDLILLDIMMPEMDGYEVCKYLKSDPRTADIPIIFLSALDDVLDKVKAFTVGAVDYITKPYQSQEVLARVQNHLTMRRLQLKLTQHNVLLQQEVEERKHTEETLRQLEAKNRAILDAIPDVMFRVNSEGIFLDYRPAKFNRQTPALEATNLSVHSTCENRKEEGIADNFAMSALNVIGKTVSEVFSEDLAAWTMHYVEQTLSTQQVQKGEYLQSVEGRWYFYEARYVVSGPGEVIAIVRDISDRKQAEATVRQSEAQLRLQQKQLQVALDELKQTQTQLILNAKMVSLGQLVAGVAHEINNPVNFIYGNLSHINQYTKDLLNLLQLYRRALPNPILEIKSALQECDAEFISTDLPKLIESMQGGAERIRAIVESLRNFSRLGQAQLKFVDIHEGIDSTLMILQHRLKNGSYLPPSSQPPPSSGIQVIKEYNDLPLIECYPRELNQVFMNILTNAIDALEKREGETMEKSPLKVPTIWIRTQLLDSKRVAIAIADNGPGMPEAVRERVFDPFFTTKAVGSGTGLGMSLSYQIVVEGHGGQIRCHSLPSQGTTFILEIPIRQAK